jgi:hypothetical protein
VTTDLAGAPDTEGDLRPAAGAVERARFVVLAGAAALIGAGMVVGWWLVHRDGIRLMQGSIFVLGGRWRRNANAWALPAVVLAVLIVWYGGALARRLPWAVLIGGAVGLSAAWATALSLVEGPAAIAAPLTAPPEYLRDVPRIRAMGLGTFLRGFTDHILDGSPGEWTTHVAGHPPLMVLILAVLASVGLGAAGWAAALCIAVGASAAGSVLSTVRRLAGEDTARRAAPFVAAAPLALWVATTADAFFAGVAAAAICALAHAAARRGLASVGLGLLAGGLIGACLFLSYGLVLLAPLALAIAIVTRRVLPLAVALAAVAAVTVAFGATGFWWWHGFELARVRVMDGPGYYARPAAYFWLIDPAVVAIAVGPAVVAAAVGVRTAGRRLLALPVGAAVAIAGAIVSGLAKGETERIYLPFFVWLLPLAALLPARSARWWLAASCGWTLLIALTTHLYW